MRFPRCLAAEETRRPAAISSGVSGGLSGLLLPLPTGIIADHFSYTPVFVLIAFMPLIGTNALFVIGRR